MHMVPEGAATVPDTALLYAAKGLRVLPLNPNTKAPLNRGGVLGASCDHKRVQRWFALRADAMVGIATGDGFGVVDVDPRHGGTVSPKWPETLTASTRSGGVHLYYATARPIGNSVGKIAPGVDFRGVNGYVVAPPSPGWSWINERRLAELPGAIVQACGAAVSRGQAGPGRALPPNWKPFEPAQRVVEGARNGYLASFAGWAVRQGLSAAGLVDELDIENRRVCVPPLDDQEVQRIALSIGRYERRAGVVR